MSNQNSLAENDDTETLRLTINENNFLLNGTAYSEDGLVKNLLQYGNSPDPVQILVSVMAETSTQRLVDGLILLNSAENLSIKLLGGI